MGTAGFLVIAVLFTAHVTGNFVTSGAAIVAGSAGVLTRLLALPMFCLTALTARLLTLRWERQGWTGTTTRSRWMRQTS